MSQRTVEEKWGKGTIARAADEVSINVPRIALLETFYQDTYGHPLPADGKRALDLRLAIEKFKYPGNRHYRLIWTGGGHACLAAEDVTSYPTRERARAAAFALALKSGVALDGRRR